MEKKKIFIFITYLSYIRIGNEKYPLTKNVSKSKKSSSKRSYLRKLYNLLHSLLYSKILIISRVD